MKYTKIFDSHYPTLVIGYKPDKAGWSIYKDSHFAYNGNEVVDGWEVYDGDDFTTGKRVFYAGTLREAKSFVEGK